jgi:hypothetical protein
MHSSCSDSSDCFSSPCFRILIKMEFYAVPGEISVEPSNPSSVAVLELILMIASGSEGKKQHIPVIKILT